MTKCEYLSNGCDRGKSIYPKCFGKPTKRDEKCGEYRLFKLKERTENAMESNKGLR
ncbi:hypothetical protein ACFL6S_03520 [Candidatus Poribacteria bacterium]